MPICVPITPNIDDGMFIGTVNDTDKIVYAPEPLVTVYPLDTGIWQPNVGSGWTAFGGDRVVVDNTDGSNLFLNAIYSIQQTVAKPVTLRLIVEGEGIASSSGGFSIELIMTDSGGLGGTVLGDQQINFPAGTWPERQFSVTVNPSAPAYYLYAYIFTRTVVGKVTIRQAELFQSGDTPRKSGAWNSKIFDLTSLANIPIALGSIPLKTIAFYYNDLSNVDDMGSVDYSIDQLKKYEFVVTNPPEENTTTRQQLVQTSLISAAVKLFGYVQVGPLPGEDLKLVSEITPHIDNCDTGDYYGVFFDMFGSDYGVSRTMQNELIDYAHSKGLKVFANAWVPASVISPSEGPVSMGTDDWVLLESYYIRGTNDGVGAYAGVPEGGFINSFNKYVQTVELAKSIGVKVCGMAYAFSATLLSDPTDLINAYILSVGLGIDSLCYNYAVESKSLDWLLSDYSIPQVGTTLITPFTQLDSQTYEAITNEGMIHFIAVDDPVSRSYKTLQIPDLIDVEIQSLPTLVAQQYEVHYFVSADAKTWTQVTNLTTDKRYLQIRIIMRG